MEEQFKMTPEEWIEATTRGFYKDSDLSKIPWNRVIAYRCRRKGEIGVGSVQSELSPADEDQNPSYCYKVFILRPRKKVTVTDVLFRATGETRPPKQGELYLDGENFFEAEEDFLDIELPIYERIETQREVEVDQ